MRKFLTILIIIIPFLCTAQKQGNIWYFGDHAGLDFNSGIPIAITNGETYDSSYHSEGTAVISDSSGSLLFYTNGQKIWNKNHQIMPNGDSLFGSWSSTQAALIIPQPGNSRYFYVFTTDAFFEDSLKYGFRYSMIDICLDNGLGDVIKEKKNIKILDTVSEKLTAVRHSNGIDYWVIIHKYFSDAIYAYLLTSAGITDTVISHIGTIHPHGTQSLSAAIGQLKASPNGQKLAIVDGNDDDSNIAEYFDFDKSTGVVSNYVNIQSNPVYHYYGVSFSPDNTKLYIACNLNSNSIFQYNLIAGGGNPDSVKASCTKISDYWNFEALQLAVDGKIYVSTKAYNGNYLAVINNPNNAGINCNYQDSAIYLNGKTASYGLPNFIDSYDYSNTTYDCKDGIEEYALENEINLYPNPSTDNLIIECPEQSTVEILNIQGQILKMIVKSGNKTVIDVSSFPSGVYIVEVRTEKGMAVKKFVKE